MSISRRSFLKQSTGLTFLAPLNSLFLTPQEEKRGPIIIYIMADELGYYELSCMGHPHLKTPNIDRMASGGVYFTQGYVSASVCGPSRCGLMTGVYQQRMGSGENPNTNGFPENPAFQLAGLPRSQPIL